MLATEINVLCKRSIASNEKDLVSTENSCRTLQEQREASMATPRPTTRLGNLFRFGSGRSSSKSNGVNTVADLRPSTSRSGQRGSGVELRTMPPNLEDKVQQLPNEMQESFHRLLGEMYEQETVTMIRFIEDARRSLALSLNELNDEQEVLALTSNKIAENRLNSASYRPKSSARARVGAQSARHRKTPAPPIPSVSPSVPLPAVPFKVSRSKTTVSIENLSQSVSARPTTAARRPGVLTASLDRVTFETERGSVAGRVKSGRQQETVEVHARPRTAYAVPYEAEGELKKEYEEESDQIMKKISGAQSRIETERERQAALLKDRKELQKVKQHQTEDKAKAIVREVTAVEEKLLKDKQRQEQMVKERLEERKRRKQEEQDGVRGSKAADESDRATKGEEIEDLE